MVYFPLVFLRYGISENAKRVTVINFQSTAVHLGIPTGDFLTHLL